MAEIVIPSGYGNGILRWHLGGTKEFSCTLGYSVGAPGTQTASDSADELFDAATATGSLCTASTMDQNWVFDGVDTYQNDGGTIHGGSSAGTPVTGTHTGNGDKLPVGVTYIAKKRTPRLGRKYRGRMYLPCLNAGSTNVSVTGAIDPTKVGQLQSILNNFYTALQASATKPYLLHSNSDDVPTIITSFVQSDTIATQRRRLGG